MTAPGAAPATLAEAMIAVLKSCGVRFLFGVPGGGSSLDLIAAADKAGMEFILCRGETAAALSASVAAELTGAPGVVLTAIGPGAASAVNGMAYAHLERAPLLLISDSREAGEAVPPHQVFDLQALFRPLAKACVRLAPDTGAAQFADLVALTLRPPEGPVFVELSANDAARNVSLEVPSGRMTESGDPPAADISSAAHNILAESRRPILLIGLQAARPELSAGLLQFGERLGCPIMTSYKAKGVIADSHPHLIGHLTGADSEAAAIGRADLIIWAGVEPVELIPAPWRCEAPVLALSDRAGLDYPARPAAEVIGPLAASIEALTASGRRSSWSEEEIAGLKDGMMQRLRLAAGDGHTAESVAAATIAAAGPDTRFTVDAGAHMLSIMAHIQASEARQVLKSTGLSTMGFALPAAIASALVAPERRTIAFTGDGGLLMCLAELSTAARLRCRLTVIVLNDAALSLIDVKQQRRQQRPVGVRYPAVDFAAQALGQGCSAWKVGPHEPLAPAIAAALAHDGASLIDIAVDPSPYGDQLAALRG
ncbi:MAG TPA: thiamine pyrophosphate-binding protein [Alphaproteobacteria bacterium]|nr:thiamine pyrophosphate-binding protein [Alphaproteobacteria bacterium]